MSALKPAHPLISIGGAMLSTIGLNPQRVSYSSEARFPAHPVQAGLRYQKTGAGAQRIMIEAQTYPHVIGGLDAYAMIKAYHRAQMAVPYMRLRGNYLGQADGICVIETLDADEERLHPFDGVGRVIDVTLGLILLPMTSALGGVVTIASVGALLL